MPSITITAEQAEALARGEDITITAEKPEPPKTVIAVHVGAVAGRVYRIKNAERVENGWRGPWERLTKGDEQRPSISCSDLSFTFSDRTFKFIEVPA